MYDRIRKAVGSMPWAIRPEMLDVIVGILEMRVNGIRLSEAELAERIGAGPSSRSARMVGQVAVLPLYGVIIPRATMMSDMSGGTSLQQWVNDFKIAVADPDVGSILIDVDSPGGSAQGVPEAGEVIRSARGRKPITAVAEGQAASGAYWLATQADEFMVSPSALVGSVGVYMAHTEFSGMDEMAGVKTTLIHAGARKVDGNEFEPLSERAAADMQAIVDEFYGMFVNAVAKGRGTSAKDVRDNFGEGSMLMPKGAVAAGMADGIATFDETLARMQTGKPVRGRAAAQAALAAEGISAWDEDGAQPVLETPTPEPEPAPEPIEAETPEPVDDGADAAAPDYVPGAERLLRHRGIREAFASRQ